MALLQSCCSYTTIVAAVLVALALYVVYQLILHPLAQYPGPISGRLTHLWSLYHAYKADRHWALHDLHQRYGPIVRYGPNHISINDSSVLEEIYGGRANVQKSRYYTAGFGISLFNCTDRQVHARKRRVTIQAFSEKAVRAMEPYVLLTIRNWCTTIGKASGDDLSTREKECADKLASAEIQKASSWSPPRDMSRWSPFLTFDTLGEIAFGKTFETTEKADRRPYFDFMLLNQRIVDITGQIPWLGHWGLDRFLRRGTTADRTRQVGLLHGHLDRRILENPDKTDRRDVLYFLMKARDPWTGEGYSTPELLAETNLFLGAGTDTTSTALSAIFYFLVRNPDVQAELTRAIRTSFEDVESIVKGETLSNLELLHACISETLRLCPPVSAILPREVRTGGQEVLGHKFSAGAIIGVPIYSLHHNAAYFDEPFRFRPSRWLESEVGASVLMRQRQAFMPFSVGPRACIAKKVALMELELSVARTLFMYDVRHAPGSEHIGVGPQGEFYTAENFTVMKRGPVVQFQARED